jgi:hypothetical protein
MWMCGSRQSCCGPVEDLREIPIHSIAYEFGSDVGCAVVEVGKQVIAQAVEYLADDCLVWGREAQAPEVSDQEIIP